MHESEKYLPIEGFSDYLITSQGRVLSLKDNHGNDRIKELKPCKIPNGYMQVTLYKNGKRYAKYVHRLVATAFIPNPEDKPEINHIDEDKSNNCVTNLEWMTHKENLNFGTRNERASKTMGDGRMKGKNNPMYGKKHSEKSIAKVSGVNNHKARAVVGFKINGCDIKYYKFIKESEKDDFSPSCISMCCRKINKSHKDYNWFYADEFFNGKDDNL